MMLLKSPFKFLSLITLVFSLIGCSSSSKKSGADALADGSGNADGLTLELNGDSDSSRAGGLSTVYFAFNSSALSGSTKDALQANASYLKSMPAVEVQIEGHADERGGIQYNLALGERRAKAVRDYLVAMGVERARITTISYGKERPIAFGHDESAWSKNRRANFVITAK